MPTLITICLMRLKISPYYYPSHECTQIPVLTFIYANLGQPILTLPSITFLLNLCALTFLRLKLHG